MHGSILRTRRFLIIMENIFIGIFAVLVFGGAVAAWWIENGPEKKDKDDKKKDN